MLNRLDQMIVLAGAAMLIGVAPALAHGGGSHGHGHSSLSAARVGASTKLSAPAATQVAPGARSTPAPLARMLVTTALGAPAMTTKVSTTSTAADPPSAPATAASTSPSAQSSGGGGGSRTDLKSIQYRSARSGDTSGEPPDNHQHHGFGGALGERTAHHRHHEHHTSHHWIPGGDRITSPRREWGAGAERRHQRCGGAGAHHCCDKQRCGSWEPRRGHRNQRRVFPNRWRCERENHARVHGGLG